MTSLIQNPPVALLSTAANYLTNAVAITTSIQTVLLDQSLSHHYSTMNSNKRRRTNSSWGFLAPADTSSSTSSSSSMSSQTPASPQQQNVSSSLLDGYAFSCDNGLFLAFSDNEELYCRLHEEEDSSSSGTTNRTCGSYHFEPPTTPSSLWTGTVVFHDQEVGEEEEQIIEKFHVQELEWIDDLLISFVYSATSTSTQKHQDYDDPTTAQEHQEQYDQHQQDVSCHAVSLNWKQYSFHDLNYVGLQCPLQQQQMTQQVLELALFEHHHFSFGMSGDVGLRSPLKVLVTPPSPMANLQRSDEEDEHIARMTTLTIRDWYGVFRLLPNHDGPNNHNSSSQQRMKIYFGAQQGRPTTVLEAQVNTVLTSLSYDDHHHNHNNKNEEEKALEKKTSTTTTTTNHNNNGHTGHQNNEDNKNEQQHKHKQESEMHLFGYYPSGPCRHDGTSALKNFHQDGFVRLMNTLPSHHESLNDDDQDDDDNKSNKNNTSSSLKQLQRGLPALPTWTKGIHQMVHHNIRKAHAHVKGISRLIQTFLQNLIWIIHKFGNDTGLIGLGGKILPTIIMMVIVVLFHNHQEFISDDFLEKLWNAMSS